jgi:hypothetical protein
MLEKKIVKNVSIHPSDKKHEVIRPHVRDPCLKTEGKKETEITIQRKIETRDRERGVRERKMMGNLIET